MNLNIILSAILINFLLFCFGNGHAKLAPDFIRPCSDTSKECIIKSAQYAIPKFVRGISDLKIPALDPLRFDTIKVPSSGLTFVFYNGTFKGLRKCIVEDAELNLEKLKYKMSIRCNMTLISKYAAKGRYLLFVINGEGVAKIKLVNMKLNVDIDIKYIKDNANVQYFGIKNYKYDVDYGDFVHFDLKNLFKENKQLSDAVLAVLNQNWKIFIEQFGKPVVDYVVEYVVKVLKIFFMAEPYHELINVPLPL